MASMIGDKEEQGMVTMDGQYVINEMHYISNTHLCWNRPEQNNVCLESKSIKIKCLVLNASMKTTGLDRNE